MGEFQTFSHCPAWISFPTVKKANFSFLFFVAMSRCFCWYLFITLNVLGSGITVQAWGLLSTETTENSSLSALTCTLSFITPGPNHQSAAFTCRTGLSSRGCWIVDLPAWFPARLFPHLIHLSTSPSFPCQLEMDSNVSLFLFFFSLSILPLECIVIPTSPLKLKMSLNKLGV